MSELGLQDVQLTEQCYLYGHLPATEGYERRPAIGFIAHMDTVSDYCEHDITPVLTKNYSGKAMEIAESGLILDPAVFPHLKSLKGQTLITSDGTTVLGVDDKAGIAEILTMIEYIQDKNIPHGKLCIAFTPDEEVGRAQNILMWKNSARTMHIPLTETPRVRFNTKILMPVRHVLTSEASVFIPVLPKIP